MRVIWTPRALANLESISDYIAVHNPDAAQRVVERVIARAEMLAEFPEAGRPGRVAGTRELFVPGANCILAYAVFARDTVRLLAVRHTSRRWPKSF